MGPAELASGCAELSHRTRSQEKPDFRAAGSSDKLTVEIKLIGDRPAGIVALDSPIVQATQRAVTVLTRTPRVTFASSSTDSNLAMSLGIPAVTIGSVLIQSEPKL